MSEPGVAPGAGHPAHDLELVARAVAGDVRPQEAQAVRDRLASCPGCAALAADLRDIAAATRELASGSQLGALRAPRDFRLTEADAIRLRGRVGGRPSRVVAWWTGRGRGLGGALAAFGLVGLLLSAGLPGLGSGAASPTSGRNAGLEQGDLTTAVPGLVPAASVVDALISTGDPEPDGLDQASTTPARAVLAAGSVMAILVGLALVIGGRGRRPGWTARMVDGTAASAGPSERRDDHSPPRA